MKKAKILIKTRDGNCIAYANKFLAPKTGNDNSLGENKGNLLFPGFPTFSYYYTGYANDDYSKQSGAGKLKGDFDFLKGQIGKTGLLKFPENSSAADTSTGSDELVRDNYRISVNLNDVVSIFISEEEIRFPYGRESGYMVPVNEPGHLGFQETKERKEKGYDRGPDFNKYWTEDTGYIPMPNVEIAVDGAYIVKNEKDYTKVIEEKDYAGNTSIYGVREILKNGEKKNKKSAIFVVPAWKFPLNINYNDLDKVVAKTEAGKEYTFSTYGITPENINGSTSKASEFGSKIAKSKGLMNITMDIENIEKANYTFYNNTKIKSVKLENADKISDATGMFKKCSKLEAVYGIERMHNLTTAVKMFEDCSKLSNIRKMPKLEKLKNADSIFNGCSGLEAVDVSGLSNVENAKWMFRLCSKLNSITGLENLSKVSNASSMFAQCSSLTSIDISGMTKIKDATEMLSTMTNLEYVNWGSIKPETINDMFKGSTKEITIEVSTIEAREFIEANATTMGLTNYIIKGGEKPKFEVSIDPNYEGAETRIEELEQGTLLSTIKEIRVGYNFNGWTLDKAGKEPAPKAVAEPLSIFAQWVHQEPAPETKTLKTKAAPSKKAAPKAEVELEPIDEAPVKK